MLNKKAIAAFAAGATLVSGLAIAAPAMAERLNANSSQGQQNQPSFHDKFEANKAYVNALNGKDANGNPDTITDSKLEELKKIATSKDPAATKKQIEDQKTPEEKRSEAFRAKFLANKTYVNALDGKGPDGTKKSYTNDELKNLKTVANSQQKESEKVSKKADNEIAEKEALAKKADADGLHFTAKLIRDSKRSKLDVLKNLLTEAEKLSKWATGLKTRVKNAGLPKSDTAELTKYIDDNASGEHEAVVDYVNSKIVEYRVKHLDVIGLHELAATVRKNYELIGFDAATKAFFDSTMKSKRDEAQSAYVNGKAALVKKAKAEGLNFVAKQIEKSQYSTLEALTNLLDQAEKDHAKEFHDKFEANKAYVNALDGKNPDGTEHGSPFTKAELDYLHKLATSKNFAGVKSDAEDALVASVTAEFKGLSYDKAKALYEKISNEVNSLKTVTKDGKIPEVDAIRLSAAQAAFNAIAKTAAETANAIEEVAKKAEHKGLTFAAKQIRKAKTVEGAKNLLAEAEKAAIETLAQKAEKEGFNFVAKYIRKVKTVEGAQALLDAARASKKKPQPKPVAPQTAKGEALVQPELPELSAADLFKGLTYDQAKALYEDMVKNAAAAGVKFDKVTDRDNDDPTVRLLNQAKAKIEQMAKDEIENIAKKAEKEGFNFVAKYIRKAKTVEGARALLAEAEKGKKPEPAPVPPTPVPPAPVPPAPVPPAPVPTPTPTPVPEPTPVPGGLTPVTPAPVTPAPETNSGSPVSENESTTLDKGELNVQVQGANSDLAAASNAAGVAQAKADLKAALAAAQKVAADPHATQAQVDAAAKKLAAARKGLAGAKARAGEATGDSGKKNKLGNTGSAVSVIGMFAAVVAAAGVTLFAGKRRGVSRHCNK